MSIPKAADLPVGTVVAADDLAGIRTANPHQEHFPWRMSNGGLYGHTHIDEMLAEGAQVLRVGPQSPADETLVYVEIPVDEDTARVVNEHLQRDGRAHLLPCGCLPNDADAHRVGCPRYPEGRRGDR